MGQAIVNGSAEVGWRPWTFVHGLEQEMSEVEIFHLLGRQRILWVHELELVA
jgi:hypothetical protein